MPQESYAIYLATTIRLPYGQPFFSSIIACYLIVALRVAGRIFTTQRFWWDDWSHVIAAVS